VNNIERPTPLAITTNDEWLDMIYLSKNESLLGAMP